MKVVWTLETATVRDVYEHLRARRDIAYTTVLTMMKILEQKGYVKKTRGRAGVRLSPGPAAAAGHRVDGARVRRSRVRRRVAADAAAPGQADETQRQGTQSAAARDRGGGGMTPANCWPMLAQITLIVLPCAGLPRLLGLRSPAVQYVFWRIAAGRLPARCRSCSRGGRDVDGLRRAPPRSRRRPSLRGTRSRRPATASRAPVSLRLGAAARRVVLPAGCAVALLWLGLGMARLRRFAARRRPRRLTASTILQPPSAHRRRSSGRPQVRHPVTFGVRRPVVLLPVALKSADPRRRSAPSSRTSSITSSAATGRGSSPRR